LTPHIGGATAETVERHSRMMTSEIVRLLDGKALRHLANPEPRRARVG
jgi:phosphoglycerate dehydrogenase-like enzyme